MMRRRDLLQSVAACWFADQVLPDREHIRGHMIGASHRIGHKLREPIPDFPDIYPDGGVQRIVAATSGHPYLVQLVCDGLCRRLNDDGRFQATSGDVEAAIDDAILDTPLFDELWRQRSDDEKRVLRRLASGEDVGDEKRGVVRGLEREGYVVRGDGDVSVAVPMFGDWIVENG